MKVSPPAAPPPRDWISLGSSRASSSASSANNTAPESAADGSQAGSRWTGALVGPAWKERGARLLQEGRERFRAGGKALAPLGPRVGAAAMRGLTALRSVRSGLVRAFRRPRAVALPKLPAAGGMPRSRRPVLALAAALLLLPLLGFLAASLLGGSPAGRTEPAGNAASQARTTEAEPAATGSLQAQAPQPAANAPNPEPDGLRGVAEVLDTATLSVQGRIVRLFGVEWARGAGDPDDLAGYLRGREVVCRPQGATDRFRCHVEGRDLSQVVLFNGGGRATPDATPDLKAAEERARTGQLGVWRSESVKARP